MNIILPTRKRDNGHTTGTFSRDNREPAGEANDRRESIFLGRTARGGDRYRKTKRPTIFLQRTENGHRPSDQHILDMLLRQH